MAARFTPLVLIAVGLYLVVTGRRRQLWSSGRVLWFTVGAAVVLVPLAVAAAGDPGIILGRSGQVSILNPAVNGGDFWGTLWSQTGKAMGMFVWRGDPILRHNAVLDYSAVTAQANPLGRPVFDLFMVGPLLIGGAWCLWHWRRPAAATLLLWQLIMLGPTILAEDTPHFLRAAGLLPGLVLLPAIGLNTIWRWSEAPRWVRRGVVGFLLIGSLLLTARDYITYGQEPEVGYLFEAAAADLATQAAADTSVATVFMDRRFSEGWPSVPFLLGDAPVTLIDEDELTRPMNGPVVRYVWPYGSLATVGESAVPPVVVGASAGPPARGDLEPAAYSLFTRYVFTPGLPSGSRADNFDNRFVLREATVAAAADNNVQVDLTWELAPDAVLSDALPSVFVHVLGIDGQLPQADAQLGGGLWPAPFWQPGVAVSERHLITLPESLDPAHHRIVVGLYWADSQKRLPLLDSGYTMVDDQVPIWPNESQP